MVQGLFIELQISAKQRGCESLNEPIIHSGFGKFKLKNHEIIKRIKRKRKPECV